MPEYHSRACIFHDFTRKIPHVFFITVDCAVGTSWFLGLIRTVGQSLFSVLEKRSTLVTQITTFTMVVRSTVHGGHYPDCISFVIHPVICRHQSVPLYPLSFSTISAQTCSWERALQLTVTSAYWVYSAYRSSKSSLNVCSGRLARPRVS